MHFSASNQQGDPNDGPDELEPNLSYLNHTPTIFSKFTHFLPLFCRFSLKEMCQEFVMGLHFFENCFMGSSYHSPWLVEKTKTQFNPKLISEYTIVPSYQLHISRNWDTIGFGLGKTSTSPCKVKL